MAHGTLARVARVRVGAGRAMIRAGQALAPVKDITLRAAVAAAGGAATRTFGPALLARLLIFAHAVALHALHAPVVRAILTVLYPAAHTRSVDESVPNVARRG